MEGRVLRVNPGGMQYTYIHAYTHTNTHTKQPAEEILEGRVVRVNREGMQARDVLLYLYYGGMVFAALKRFQRAFDMFHLAFTMPSQREFTF